MELTLRADWREADDIVIKRTADYRQLVLRIAGYSAAVEQMDGVWQYTVLHDHLEVVEVGQRTTLAAAKVAAEVLIGTHAAKS